MQLADIQEETEGALLCDFSVCGASGTNWLVYGRPFMLEASPYCDCLAAIGAYFRLQLQNCGRQRKKLPFDDIATAQ